jgi:hypothetical protein
MKEQLMPICKRYSTDVLWMFGSVEVFILWCVFTCLQCFYKDVITGRFLGDIIPHVVFLSVFFVSAIVSYKIFKIKSEMQEKENEFDRKVMLEKLQLEKYEKNKEQKNNNSDMESKIKEVFISLMEEQKCNYNEETLKTLVYNVRLFNEVKKIIEPFVDKENTQTTKS